MYFSGDLPELEFEQGGRKYWVLAGLPGGLGFDVYPPGQKLTIYLQRLGFASGTPVAVMTLAKLPAGATSTTVVKGRTLRNSRMGEGARRQEATFASGSASFHSDAPRFIGAKRGYTLISRLKRSIQAERWALITSQFCTRNLLPMSLSDAPSLVCTGPRVGTLELVGITS